MRGAALGAIATTKGRIYGDALSVAIGLLLAAAGLGMAIPGAFLVAFGGSPYYIVAGTLIVASAVLILRRQAVGLQLYILVFLATLAWSLWEVGFAPGR